MKKLFLLVAAFIMLGIAPMQAQTAAPAKQSTPAATTKMKKDGTPDKRYKDSKAAAAPAGPTKKDGTPDMRYKANKAPAAKK